MATPFDVQLDELPKDERAEVRELLAARPPAVWHSDEGDGLAFHLLFGLAALGGAVACALEVHASLPYSGLGALDAPVLGLALCLIIIGQLLRRFFELHRRHGWLITTFAYMRVRGSSLRLVRWTDITRVHRRVVGSGRSKFAMVDLTTAKGTFESDTAIFFGDIKRRISADAIVEE